MAGCGSAGDMTIYFAAAMKEQLLARHAKPRGARRY